jgi:16S rRNA (guanine(966)-N(2))-methyltransferase RsmD
MRVTGGTLRGRHLVSIKGLRIRPSADRVKEAIFNLIGQDLAGASVLDLFAGTGALGVEALSRGASSVLFVDKAEQAVRSIKKNLKQLGYEGAGAVLKRDLSKGLPSKHPFIQGGIDVTFLDPPYRSGLIPALLRELCDKRLLRSHSVVVAESSRDETMPEHTEGLTVVKTRSYGETKVTIFRTTETLP